MQLPSFRLIDMGAVVTKSAGASVFGVFLLATLSASTIAQGNHTLQGRAVMPNGVPPANPVKITLTLNGRRVHETFTDLSGRFLFPGLVKGVYQLTAEGDGATFESTTVYAEVVALGNAPQTVTQNIPLRPRSDKAVAPAAVISIHELDPSVPQRAWSEYQKGLKRASEGDVKQAIKHFQAAIQAHSPFYAAHVAIGEQYTKRQQYAEARETFRKAIEIRPDRAEAYVGLGVAMVKEKSYDEAITHLRRSIEIDEQSSAAYMFLGLAEMQIGQYDAAEPNLLRAYEMSKTAAILVYLANLYELRGEPERAIDRLKDFLNQSPESAAAPQIREAIEKLRRKAKSKE